MPVEIECYPALEEPAHKVFKFPAGELNVQLHPDIIGYGQSVGSVDIVARLYSSDDVMELLLVHDALYRCGITVDLLTIPYFPYARQDRVCNDGEALSVKVVADLINLVSANTVIIYDPHSDVTPALINNVRVMTQPMLFPSFRFDDSWMVVCPDAGAEKKIMKLGRPYIMAGKVRDTSTGQIIRTEVYHKGFIDQKCIIVDDICDGGRTFIELARVLRDKKAPQVDLYVTHGIFSKGMEVFEGLIDRIFYYENEEIVVWESSSFKK